MAIVPVVKTDTEEGKKTLAAGAQRVDIEELKAPAFQALIENMKDTMKATKGVGIAAPQIGVLKSVVVVGFEENERYPGEMPVPLIVLVNPVLRPLSDRTVQGWEGCLSVPNVRGLVPRYEQIEVKGLDPGGHDVVFEASGFYARIWQHECDHLKGKLFTQAAVRLISEDDYVLMQKTLAEMPDNASNRPDTGKGIPDSSGPVRQ